MIMEEKMEHTTQRGGGHMAKKP